MRPHRHLAACLAAFAAPAALAAPPSAPGDLRVDVYSGTAAELFWSRSTDPDGFVRGYEIRRDGQLVDTRDGLSYFTDGLTDGRAFAFTVTAIDFDGERSAPASVSVVGGDRDGAIGFGGGRPAPPANLRSEVYSSSAAEVFWDRSDQRGLSYEVLRNGEVVATTDGTSAFLSGLARTDGETIDVIAIDANGRRSGAATVTLGGGGASDPGPGTGGPPAPANARIEVYSGTAAELFFDRAPFGANVAETEIVRDGTVLGTTRGTSFFDDTRDPGREYAYELTAIDASGNRSPATTVGGSNAPGVDSVVALDNADSLLLGFAFVLERNPGLFLSAPLRRLALFSPRFSATESAPGLRMGATARIPDGEDRGGDRTAVTCIAGGGYTVDDFGGQFGNFRLVLDACELDGRVYDGVATLGFTNQAIYDIDYEGASVTFEDGSRIEDIGGSFERFATVGLNVARNALEGVEYVNGRLEVRSLDLLASDETARSPRTELSASYEVSGPFTGGRTLQVDTPMALKGIGEGSPYPVSGQIVFDDGSRTLTVDADTGDRATYSIVLDDGTGAVTTDIGRWRADTGPPCVTVSRRSERSLPDCDAG